MKRAGRRMSKRRPCQSDDEPKIRSIFSRRDFVRSGALVAAALAAWKDAFGGGAGPPPAGDGSAIQLGVARYTFRTFKRAQLTGFLQQLNAAARHEKDTSDHPP